MWSGWSTVWARLTLATVPEYQISVKLEASRVRFSSLMQEILNGVCIVKFLWVYRYRKLSRRRCKRRRRVETHWLSMSVPDSPYGKPEFKTSTVLDHDAVLPVSLGSNSNSRSRISPQGDGFESSWSLWMMHRWWITNGPTRDQRDQIHSRGLPPEKSVKSTTPPLVGSVEMGSWRLPGVHYPYQEGAARLGDTCDFGTQPPWLYLRFWEWYASISKQYYDVRWFNWNSKISIHATRTRVYSCCMSCIHDDTSSQQPWLLILYDSKWLSELSSETPPPMRCRCMCLLGMDAVPYRLWEARMWP